MRIAFCVSGVPRSDVIKGQPTFPNFKRCFASWRRAFPDADFFFATWKQHKQIVEDNFQDSNVCLFDEPEVNYHPFFDIPDDLMWSDRLLKIVPKYKTITDSRQDRYQHQTKQILCHAHLLETLNLQERYDIIIRCRYDTLISKTANFDSIIKEVYNQRFACGFALLRDHNFSTIHQLGKKDLNAYRFLFDSLIIHSSKVFDPQYVFELHENKRLLPCEFGWFQIMSMPYGENHRCYSGWANAERAIPQRYISGAY